MPPEPFEYQGLEAIDEFFRQAFTARGDRTDRLVATRANGQPAFGHYIGDAHAPVVRGVGVIVLTLDGDRISHLTRFGGSHSAVALRASADAAAVSGPAGPGQSYRFPCAILRRSIAFS